MPDKLAEDSQEDNQFNSKFKVLKDKLLRIKIALNTIESNYSDKEVFRETGLISRQLERSKNQRIIEKPDFCLNSSIFA